jgi:hypothetical protein
MRLFLVVAPRKIAPLQASCYSTCSLKTFRRVAPRLMAIRQVFPIQKTAALALLAFGLCSLARGQSFITKQSVDIFAGYSYLSYDSKPLGFSDRQNLNGWNAEIALPYIYKGLGAVVDASAGYNHELSAYNFLIGPQYSFDVGNFHVIAHGMFGKARDRLGLPGSTRLEPSSLARDVAFGGSVERPIGGKLSWRLVQGDYLIDSNFGSRHNIRLSTGIVVRFGKH